MSSSSYHHIVFEKYHNIVNRLTGLFLNSYCRDMVAKQFGNHLPFLLALRVSNK
jgi:hypothetical protein